MKQFVVSRRSCSLGASSLLAVAAVGFAAAPAVAGTPHARVRAQTTRTIGKPAPRPPLVVVGKKTFRVHRMRPGPRMNLRGPRMNLRGPRMNLRGPRMS